MKLEDLHNKNTGFKAPKDFFETFEDAILHQAELKARVPKSGFTVPEGYFNTLDTKILNSVKANKTKVRTLHANRWVYATSIAATIALLFSLTFTNKHTTSFDAINNESLESFILNQELNTKDMAALISDTEIIATKILEDAISDASIEHYLESEIELEDLNKN